MRTSLWLALLLTILTALPADGSVPRGPGPVGVGPVKIFLLDGCAHARVEERVAGTRTVVPVETNSSAMDLAACQLDPTKALATLTDLAKRLEAERAAAVRRRAPVPINIVYTGAFLEGGGVAGSWSQAVKRLSQIAVIISPGGNNPVLSASQVWPSSQFSFKVGNAPDGAPTGSAGPAIAVYVDYGQPLEVVVNGSTFQAGGSSTAAMLVSAHLANVLKDGAGRKLSPDQILKKLKTAFTERVLAEHDLELRLRAALR
ncbi:MAG: hypothetical protein QOF89_158 [Acidobacteriota bacterium]|jgi:hypothetical protein|nr:hypothetical protein [Acidobacteriota bacterium]